MDKKDATESKAGGNLDCTVCLQPCVQPVKLPCNHIFCFLCAKGIIQNSNQCALCRRTIPQNYLSKPQFVQQTTGEPDSSYRWFYRGQSGWWQYDDRTCSEIETAYQNDEQECEVLIAGNLYIIDFTTNRQMQKFRPNCCRAIKRDRETIPKKGVAGVYLNAASDSDCCKASCSKSDEPTAPPRQEGNPGIILVIPHNGISGVCVNLNNEAVPVPADPNVASSPSSEDACCKSAEPERLVVPTAKNANEEKPMSVDNSESSSSNGSGSGCVTFAENLMNDSDDDGLPQLRGRKRRKATDILHYTQRDMYKSFATTVVSKLQDMSKTQRLFAEKLINDALFRGTLEKLSEDSCIC